jgi:hypothetical protein
MVSAQTPALVFPAGAAPTASTTVDHELVKPDRKEEAQLGVQEATSRQVYSPAFDWGPACSYYIPSAPPSAAAATGADRSGPGDLVGDFEL